MYCINYCNIYSLYIFDDDWLNIFEVQITFVFCRENLIRIAFQCLQLVVTDFLPLMPCKCLPLCLETTAKFGMQTRELNISLTAVGLMVFIIF